MVNVVYHCRDNGKQTVFQGMAHARCTFEKLNFDLKCMYYVGFYVNSRPCPINTEGIFVKSGWWFIEGSNPVPLPCVVGQLFVNWLISKPETCWHQALELCVRSCTPACLLSVLATAQWGWLYLPVASTSGHQERTWCFLVHLSHEMPCEMLSLHFVWRWKPNVLTVIRSTPEPFCPVICLAMFGLLGLFQPHCWALKAISAILSGACAAQSNQHSLGSRLLNWPPSITELLATLI